ncbi:hypothetical protein H6F43_06955 [Leptolyngbya sp. FACHB-36]|nr:hypothetical protein [Leptolyngbya sp. FACHB-36]
MKVLYWLCVAAGLWFAYLNIAPYAQAVQFILSNVTDTSLMQVLMSLWVIGPILRFFNTAGHWVIGVILWGIIQTIKVFPIILKHDRSFMRTVLSESEQAHRFPIHETDDPTAKALKSWYNRFPMLTISTARTWALFAYVVDFLICITIYPPCEGGFGQLFFLLMTGQWTELDWANIALLLVTLFVVEAIVKFLLWLGQIAYYYRVSPYRQ